MTCNAPLFFLPTLTFFLKSYNSCFYFGFKTRRMQQVELDNTMSQPKLLLTFQNEVGGMINLAYLYWDVLLAATQCCAEASSSQLTNTNMANKNTTQIFSIQSLEQIFVDAQAWPTFIIPETREGLARRTWRGSWVIKKGPRCLHL